MATGCRLRLPPSRLRHKMRTFPRGATLLQRRCCGFRDGPGRPGVHSSTAPPSPPRSQDARDEARRGPWPGGPHSTRRAAGIRRRCGSMPQGPTPGLGRSGCRQYVGSIRRGGRVLRAECVRRRGWSQRKPPLRMSARSRFERRSRWPDIERFHDGLAATSRAPSHRWRPEAGRTNLCVQRWPRSVQGTSQPV